MKPRKPCSHCGGRTKHTKGCTRHVPSGRSFARPKTNITTAESLAECIKSALDGDESGLCYEHNGIAVVEVKCDGTWWEITVKGLGVAKARSR